MCRWLRVSRSGYYAWRVREEGARARRDRALDVVVRAVHASSGGVYGSPKVHRELLAKGIRCGRHKVAKLMRRAGLKGCPKKRYRAKSAPALSQNLLNRQFAASEPNRRWVSDITQVSTGKGWLYVAAVMDLCSRRIVGWSMSRYNTRHIVVAALKMALMSRRPRPGLIVHSDRGAQYLSDDYQALVRSKALRASMNAAGSCYDNAAMESFFGLLKRERVNRVRYRDREEARADVFDYIERFYNRERIHSYLGYVSPVDFEERILKTT